MRRVVRRVGQLAGVRLQVEELLENRVALEVPYAFMPPARILEAAERLSSQPARERRRAIRG